MLAPSLAIDTSPEAAALQRKLIQQMSPADKVTRIAELTEAACRWSLAGLRQRHPAAPDSELLLRLAVLRLGAETVRRAYGWSGSRHGA